MLFSTVTSGGKMTSVSLNLLRAMELERDGLPVALPSSRKTRAMLAYLAITDRAVRRDHLCSMLWDIPDDPRGALRWSLSKLRGVVDDERTRLVADRETVRLECSDIDIDWRRLATVGTDDIRKIDTVALNRAAALQGELLADLELPRCDGYQAWLAAMREDVRRWQAAILRELIRRPIDPERALEVARLWVEIDPYDALARVALIDLLDRTGRRSEADAQRALGVRKLDEAAIAVPTAMRAPAAAGGANITETDDDSDARLPPHHVRFCTASDGTGLAYSVVGEGPALVKTANWLNHLDYDWESPMWRHWLRAIIRERRLVRYDERANGLSDWNTADISFDAFVDDLVSVVDAAGLDRFDLLGISQGCSVSIAYAVRHPERVRRLILFGGYAAGWRLRGSAEEIARREAMLTLTRQGWGQDNPAFRQMFTSLFFPDANAADHRWFNELQRMSTSPDNAVRLQEAFARIDVRALLEQVSVPTLVLHARDDAVIPFAAGRELAARIPKAEFVALESHNHLLLEKEPAWARAIERIRDFLA